MRTPLALLGVLYAAPLLAQVADPPWLREFPTVDRVKQSMRVSDPRETALRQMGAFWQLQHILKAMAGRREFGELTAGETRLIQTYYEAQFYVGQAADSAFPGPYGRWQKLSQNSPYAFGRSDPRFGVEGIEVFKLLTPAIQDRFYQEVGGLEARIAARARADTQNMLRAQAEQAEAQRELAGKGAEERQIARCVESGRSQLQCVMEGVGKGFGALFGDLVPGLKKQPIYGIRLGGVYPASNKFSLTFYTEAVTVTCQDLVPESHEYAVAMTAGGLQIAIANSPKPLVLSADSDGRLTGSGPVDIAGQVIVGYQEGVRTWSDGRTEPITRPVYAPATRRCSIGTLVATGPSPVMGSSSTAPAAGINALLGSPDKDAGKPSPAGLRMNGEYGTQAGFDMEFRPEGVVVGCREATVLRPYAVKLQGSQVSIQVQHGPSPFTLALGTDGRLSGAGAIRVDGRVVAGTDANGEIAYAPRSATCAVGNIGPTSGAPAPPPSALVTSRAAPAGSAALSLAIGIPAPVGGSSPVAGRGFLLLDASVESIFAEIGVRTAPGGSPFSALRLACEKQASACQRANGALSAHTVAKAEIDREGKATFPAVEPGTYYLFGTGMNNGRSLLWNLRVALKAGNNTVLLDERNAAPPG